MYPTEPTRLLGATDDPVAAPPPRRRGNALKVVLVVLATVLLVGVPSAVALVVSLNKPAGDRLAPMVPASVDVYATAMLNPSLSQKRDLQALLSHFPELRNGTKLQKDIDSALHDALSPVGLDYQKDVKPWMGSQIAALASFGSNGVAAALVRTNDQKAALTALGRLRQSDQGRDLTWRTATHGGVSISVGSSRGDGVSTKGLDYAVFDGVAMVAGDETLIDQVIDTDQGRRANLASLLQYQQTLEQLPADFVGVAYVNAASLVRNVKANLPQDLSKLPRQLRDGVDALDAYQSFGAAVSLQKDGIAVDTVTTTDPAKLPAAMREALGRPAHRTAMLDWTPQDSWAVFTSGDASDKERSAVGSDLFAFAAMSLSQSTPSGPDLTAPPGLSETATAPTLDQQLQDFGLTGPDGLLDHLTGTSAFFVGPGTGSLPFSAVFVAGTDDSARTAAVLQKLGDLATGGSTVRWRQWPYDGAPIHYLDLGPDAGGIMPAYTVVDGYAVIGTDPLAVQHAVDTHRGTQPGITSTRDFRGSPAVKATGGVVFVDIPLIVDAIEGSIEGSSMQDFQKNVKPNLQPLRTLTSTSSSDARHQTTHTVLQIGS